MLLCSIGAYHQQGIGPGQAGDGVGHGSAPQGIAQPCHSGSMAEPGHMVDVVGLEGRPGQLHEQVVLLIGALGRGEDRQGVRPELIAQFP